MWVCWPGTAQDHLRHCFSVRPVALVRELLEFKLPPLRSGDALHLARAKRQRLTIASADLALAVAHGGRFVSFPSASKASTPETITPRFSTPCGRTL